MPFFPCSLISVQAITCVSYEDEFDANNEVVFIVFDHDDCLSLFIREVESSTIRFFFKSCVSWICISYRRTDKSQQDKSHVHQNIILYFMFTS
jgi:hypothetical protein